MPYLSFMATSQFVDFSFFHSSLQQLYSKLYSWDDSPTPPPHWHFFIFLQTISDNHNLNRKKTAVEMFIHKPPVSTGTYLNTGNELPTALTLSLSSARKRTHRKFMKRKQQKYLMNFLFIGFFLLRGAALYFSHVKREVRVLVVGVHASNDQFHA